MKSFKNVFEDSQTLKLYLLFTGRGGFGGPQQGGKPLSLVEKVGLLIL